MNTNRKSVLDRAVTILKTAQTAHNPNAAKPAAKTTRLNDTTFYIAVRVDGMAGTNSLIDSNTKRLVGITNFDGDVLKAGRDLVIDAVKLQYTDVGTLPENADWGQPKALPAALLNSELRLKQSGDNLVDIPVEDIRGFNSEDYREISTTPLLKSLETFELELEFPKGVSVAAGAPLFARISFRVTHAKR